MLAVSAGCQTPVSDDVKAASQLKAGSIITFGRYPQTESGEIKPIEWRVLEVKDNKVLLLADKGLAGIPYNVQKMPVTWKTSSIRQWLNADFYNAAFNESEKSRVAVTDLKNPDNPEFGTRGGDDTRDRIFLLSPDEAEWYLMYDADRVMKPTLYADKHCVYVSSSGNSWWWLRSPGDMPNLASRVGGDGAFYLRGHIVSTCHIAARPALWIKL